MYKVYTKYLIKANVTGNHLKPIKKNRKENDSKGVSVTNH